MTVCYAAM